MGYYLEVENPAQRFDKAETLSAKFGGRTITQEEAATLVNDPETTAVVCVVSNGIFEAAAYCYSKREFEAFTRPEDNRPKIWVAFDNVAEIRKACGYNK